MTVDDLAVAVEAIAKTLPRSQVEALARALEHQDHPSASLLSNAMSVVPTPAFANLAGRLLDGWAADPAGISGAGLAIALTATARALDEVRKQEAIEIVWTGPLTNQVPVRLTREALLDVVRAATKELFVVSFAAYKVQDVVNALGDAADSGVKVRLVLETAKADGGTLSVGAAATFKALREKAHFYIWAQDKRPVIEKGRAALHAKGAVADDHTALVTSANLTGFAIKENMELGILLRGGSVPGRLAALFRELIARGVLAEIP
jgi:phosphatidylserine/phosphatidylglycerophosphate/cardiolipin synthase-like enzyme